MKAVSIESMKKISLLTSMSLLCSLNVCAKTEVLSDSELEKSFIVTTEIATVLQDTSCENKKNNQKEYEKYNPKEYEIYSLQENKACTSNETGDALKVVDAEPFGGYGLNSDVIKNPLDMLNDTNINAEGSFTLKFDEVTELDYIYRSINGGGINKGTDIEIPSIRAGKTEFTISK